MSYLNSNTKIISIDESNDKLVIDFNDNIFNDKESLAILDEVIYTISLSLFDNYDVKQVIFTVNEQEIYKSN